MFKLSLLASTTMHKHSILIPALWASLRRRACMSNCPLLLHLKQPRATSHTPITCHANPPPSNPTQRSRTAASIHTSQHFLLPSKLANKIIAITGQPAIHPEPFRPRTNKALRTRSDRPCRTLRTVSRRTCQLVLEKSMHLRLEDIEKHITNSIHLLALKSSRS